MTREEKKQRESAFKTAIESIGKARSAIVAKHGKNRGVAGEMPCPVDGGTLRYSIASLNGHIHAACSNSGCVRWME